MPPIAAPPAPAIPGSVGVGFAVGPSVASSAASFPGKLDDGGAAPLGNRLAKASDSSDNASTRWECGGESLVRRFGSAVRIHDLLHTFVSGGLLVGEGLPMIGKLLGHTQVQTTARYAHLANDPVKSAANRIASRIAEVAG